MTAVVETFRKEAVLGDLKMIVIQTDATAATSATIDLSSDATNGRGVVMTQILNTYLQDDAGTNIDDLAFVPATGILTMPTISTGIHNITIIGY